VRPGDLPYTDIAALRDLAESQALDPLQMRVADDDFETARLVNERILALEPEDYLPPLRLSRVHLYWQKRARTSGDVAHHEVQRSIWLGEALLRNPPAYHRQLIEHALRAIGHQLPEDPRARRTRSVSQLRRATLPSELMALARSFRDDTPRLPHLALIASNRAVAYSDMTAGAATDPERQAERYGTRVSLGASLRKVDRAKDAIATASAARDMDPKNPVAWTVLIAATRDGDGPYAAVQIAERAVMAVGLEVARADGYFAQAAAIAYEHAGQFEQAGMWWGAVITSDDVPRDSRNEVLARVRAFVTTLRDRQLHAEADELAALLDEAQTLAA
jgi:tetratricopeptide (TPR) repeat protein